MSQKGGLARGYKPVVGVRAFLAEDQTEGSTTAKSDTVFFPHSASSYHCCSTMTAAHALDYSATVSALRGKCYLIVGQQPICKWNSKSKKESWECRYYAQTGKTHMVTKWNFHLEKHKSKEQSPADCTYVLNVHMNDSQSQSLTQWRHVSST